MQYDRLGFPIPRDFQPPPGRPGPGVSGDPRDRFGDREQEIGTPARRSAGRFKKVVLLLALGCVVVPAVAAPVVLPWARDAVVHWSLERATIRDARGQFAKAATDVGRAIDWLAPDDVVGRSELHCWRSALLLADRQPAAAVAEAGRAATLVPALAQPRRTRALAHVVAGDAEAALADAAAAVELSGPGNPEALNHRAYVRALVGRELEAALTDVELALAGSGAESPEFLDTRGFILHLLGRHREAIDDLNRAIGKEQQRRRQAAGGVGRVHPAVIARELRAHDQALAVMHHHRGLACRAVGLDRQADQDFAVAEQKGFDPGRGVL